MSTIVLDSLPSVRIRIPSEANLNVSPRNRGRKLRGQPKNVVKPPANIYSAEFKRDAQDYLNTPNIERRDSYHPSEKTTPIVAKNTANLANIIAVAHPSSKTATPRPKAKSKPKASKKTAKKKTLMKPKK